MSESTHQRTILYLIRHGATEANLARPARIQGRRHNPPLARIGPLCVPGCDTTVVVYRVERAEGVHNSTSPGPASAVRGENAK